MASSRERVYAISNLCYPIFLATALKSYCTLIKQALAEVKINQTTSIPPKPGQKSVWDYPRPARLEDTLKPLKIVFNGVVLAETKRCFVTERLKLQQRSSRHQ